MSVNNESGVETAEPKALTRANRILIAQQVWDEHRAAGVAAGQGGADADECPFPAGLRMVAWLDGWSST